MLDQSNADAGSFYVVQLLPDAKPRRVKLGWSKNPYARLATHRCAAPTARLLAYWDCPRPREGLVIAMLTRQGCRRVSREVYDVESVRTLLAHARSLFAQFDASDAAGRQMLGD